MEERVSFFDIATKLTGWCSGSGDVHPAAGAWRLPQVGDDNGALGAHFIRLIDTHVSTYRPTSIGYETPLLVPTDHRETLRKIYGLGFLLETRCEQLGIPCWERDYDDLKLALTGNRRATKDDMVEVALLCGIDLPPTKAEGKEDAADAFAGWTIGIRDLNPPASRRWDRLIYSRGRGGLL